jgi:hypothetical protein
LARTLTEPARDPRFNLTDYLSNRLRDADRPLFTITKEGMRRAGVPERAPDRPAPSPLPPPPAEAVPAVSTTGMVCRGDRER